MASSTSTGCDRSFAVDENMNVAATPTNPDAQKRSRKRKITPNQWKKNLRKLKRASGESYTNTSNTVREALSQQPLPNCRCQCKTKISAEEAADILKNFRAIKDHVKQNIYLRGCCVVSPVKRRRPRKDDGTLRRTTTYKYQVIACNRTVTVCQKVFLSLHNVKQGRLRAKVQNLETGVTVDNRGKHKPSNKTPDALKKKIMDFIDKFPAHESHYSRKSNKKRKYLDASISIAQLHKDYNEKNPEDQTSYYVFNQIFVSEFNVAFGFPRSDKCDTCEEMIIAISKAESDVKTAKGSRDKLAAQKILSDRKTSRDLHLRKADAFYTLVKEIAVEAKHDNTMFFVSMDYEKNMPLPLANIGKEYYKRQLWLYLLGIHNEATNEATMYMGAEHLMQKGANETLSVLDHYLKCAKASNSQLQRIVIVMDNTHSTNKNRYLLSYCEHLVTSGRFSDVNVHFPVPGHSYMSCDRDFALIEKKSRKLEKVDLPTDWVSVVEGARNNPSSFKVVFIGSPLTSDLKEDGVHEIAPIHDHKTLLDQLLKCVIPLQQMRGTQFNRTSEPKSQNTMTGPFTDKIRLWKRGVGRASVNLYKPRLINGKHGINPKKLDDVKELLRSVPFEHATCNFYESLTGGDDTSDTSDVD